MANNRTATLMMVCLMVWGGTSLLCAQSRTAEGGGAVRDTLNRRDLLIGDTLSRKDSLREDTLRTVTVRPGQRRIPLTNGTQKEVKAMQNARKYSLNGILERVAPTLHDQILHPFGFKERKMNRKRKKVQKVLWQYDAIPMQDPLQLLLDSVAREMDNR